MGRRIIVVDINDYAFDLTDIEQIYKEILKIAVYS